MPSTTQSKRDVAEYVFWIISEIQRQETSTTACTTWWAKGTNKMKKCTLRKIIFCSGLTRVAKAGQKSFVPARRAQGTKLRKEPFVMYRTSRVPPPLPQFQQSAGATPIWSFWFILHSCEIESFVYHQLRTGVVTANESRCWKKNTSLLLR
jgi:hypothetical protein